MRKRPLQFPTYVFNAAGDMRLVHDRNQYDALGPGWENDPTIATRPPSAADALPKTDDEAPFDAWVDSLPQLTPEEQAQLEAPLVAADADEAEPESGADAPIDIEGSMAAFLANDAPKGKARRKARK